MHNTFTFVSDVNDDFFIFWLINLYFVEACPKVLRRIANWRSSLEWDGKTSSSKLVKIREFFLSLTRATSWKSVFSISHLNPNLSTYINSFVNDFSIECKGCHTWSIERKIYGFFFFFNLFIYYYILWALLNRHASLPTSLVI